jgi:hypothetical protein
LNLDEPTLAAFFSASIQGFIATGYRAGQPAEHEASYYPRSNTNGKTSLGVISALPPR